MIATLAAVAALVFLDQSSKVFVQRAKVCHLAGGALVLRCVLNPVRLRKRALPRLVMSCIWVVALLSVLALQGLGHFQGLASATGLGMALGGAAGNLLDLWRGRGIVDFIDLGWWPVFNLADAGIVVGLLLAFLA